MPLIAAVFFDSNAVQHQWPEARTCDALTHYIPNGGRITSSLTKLDNMDSNVFHRALASTAFVAIDALKISLTSRKTYPDEAVFSSMTICDRQQRRDERTLTPYHNLRRWHSHCLKIFTDARRPKISSVKHHLLKNGGDSDRVQCGIPPGSGASLSMNRGKEFVFCDCTQTLIKLKQLLAEAFNNTGSLKSRLWSIQTVTL